MTSIKKLKNDILTIKNSVEFIKDSNCIFVLKHLLVVLDDIVSLLSTFEIKNKPKTNICKYCKTNKTNSLDEDVLCESCRELFGHTFYSEL